MKVALISVFLLIIILYHSWSRFVPQYGFHFSTMAPIRRSVTLLLCQTRQQKDIFSFFVFHIPRSPNHFIFVSNIILIVYFGFLMFPMIFECVTRCLPGVEYHYVFMKKEKFRFDFLSKLHKESNSFATFLFV